MENLLFALVFSIGLIIGILATSFANRRASTFGQRAELEATQDEFMAYRELAQEALSTTQENLDELRSQHSELQTKLTAFNAKLSEPPTSFACSQDSTTHKLPLLKEQASSENSKLGSSKPTPPADYVVASSKTIG